MDPSPEAYALTPGAAPAPSAASLSPFSAPLDLSAAIGALVAATGLSAAPAYAAPGYAAPGYGASGAPAPGLSEVSHVSAVAPPPSALAASSQSTPSPISPEPSAPAASPNAFPDAGSIAPRYAPSADGSPFGTSADLDAFPRGLTGLPQTSAPPNAGLIRNADAATAPPTVASAGAPSVAIAPVFTQASSGVRTYDAATIRNDFPILQEKVHGHRLIWLDNGATTQKPQAVIDRLAAFYAHENSNVHRGAHTLAARATDAYEAARDKVRRFVNASSPKEIVFVRGTTEGINLVAQAWGRRNVRAGDEIVVTWLEHHANIVPWQQLCLETGARLRVAPVDDRGDILLDEYEKLLGPAHPDRRADAWCRMRSAR